MTSFGRDSMNMANILHVCFAVDRSYLLPLAASVRSVIDNSSTEDFLYIDIICSGLSASDRERLGLSWAGMAGVEVRLIDHRAHEIDSFPVQRPGLWSSANYLPLLLAEYLGDRDRTIFLDADTITMCSLAELYATPLGESALGAVVDPWNSQLEAAGIQGLETAYEAAAPCFNTGVMVMDLSYWRRNAVAEDAMDYIRKFGAESMTMEQEALNRVLIDRFLPLDGRWNYMNYWEDPFPALRGEEPPDSMCVRHYEGRRKPWTLQSTNTGSQREFFVYLDRTGWSGWRPGRGS